MLICISSIEYNDRFSDLNKNTRTEGGLPVISERNIHSKAIAN